MKRSLKKTVMSKKRILFASTKSGGGKTLITCGFLNVLKNHGLDVCACKCGPDYIDPMFHRAVLQTESGNLDTFFSGRDGVRKILQFDPHAYCVIEGVMGIYDGIGGLKREASSYDVASATDTPVILIVDAKGLGRTVISLVKGILSDDKEHRILGIVCNEVSAKFYERLKPVMEEELRSAGYDARPVGYLPKLSGVDFAKRHLGLLMPDEIENFSEQIRKVADAIEACWDVPAVLSIMESAGDLGGACSESSLSEALDGSGNSKESDLQKNKSPENVIRHPLRLAVARDEAFCFYYRENLKLFAQKGVEIVPFSPLHDHSLPENVQGILLGGGYPELYAKALSENTDMIDSVKNAIRNGMPSLAECGGFLYLHEELFDEEGTAYPMAGVIKGSCRKQNGLTRFGYVTLQTVSGKELPDGSLAHVLAGMHGHEFHYYDSTDNGSDMLLQKAGEEISWPAMHVSADRVFGFAHLYYASDPAFVDAFIDRMRVKKR